MEKEFIPYDLALALKELGFDETCFGFYNNAESTPYIKQDFNDDLRKIYKGDFEAPTFSQAFRWFREKYSDLDFGIDKIHNVTNNYHYHINFVWEFFEGAYEEAELACLEKLIEIVKVEHPTKPGYKRKDIVEFIKQFKKNK